MLKVFLLVVAALVVADTPATAEHAAWLKACQLSGYSCRNIREPYVVEAPMEALLGRYRMGDKYVLVNENLTERGRYVVLVHEMTHYLQYKHGKWTYTHEGNCRSEREAFAVGNAAAREIDAPGLIVDWNDMRAQYGCAE